MNVDNPGMVEGDVTVALGEDYPDLRNSVRRICRDFPASTGASSTRRAPIRPSSCRR